MSSTSISEYRKFIFSLCEEITAGNLDSLKFLCRDILTARELEEIGNNAMDLVVSLEQRNELTSDNFYLLEDLLTQIKREDLVQKLTDYKTKQHREPKGTERVIIIKPKTRSLVLNNNLQENVPDGKLPTSSSGNNKDSRQAGFTPRGELYIFPGSLFHVFLSIYFTRCVRKHNVLARCLYDVTPLSRALNNSEH